MPIGPIVTGNQKHTEHVNIFCGNKELLLLLTGKGWHVIVWVLLPVAALNFTITSAGRTLKTNVGPTVN